jgi:hypothetical protein
MPNATTLIPLSGSSGGRGILVAATATPGTVVHATGISATVSDEIVLYAVNSDTVDRKLTIEFGGVTVPNDLIEVTIPAESGLVLVVPGIGLYGTGAAARTCAAWAATTNVIVLYGFVRRVVP